MNEARGREAKPVDSLPVGGEVDPPPLSLEFDGLASPDSLILSLPIILQDSETLLKSPSMAGVRPSLVGILRSPVTRPRMGSVGFSSSVRTGASRHYRGAEETTLERNMGATTGVKTLYPRSAQCASEECFSWTSAMDSCEVRSFMPVGSLCSSPLSPSQPKWVPNIGKALMAPDFLPNGSREEVAFVPITLEDLQLAVQWRIEKYQDAMRLINHTGDNHMNKDDDDSRSIKPVLCPTVGCLEAQRGVFFFIASFLFFNRYNEALRLFRKHLPIAEKRLLRCQQQRQKKSEKCEERYDAVRSPTYALTNDDLLLFTLEYVRQEHLLNDMLPWHEINCWGRDYRLQPLEYYQQYTGPKKEKRDAARSEKTAGCIMGVGGSLDLLIEVLVFTETDTPFTTGVPIFNYTNTFILLSSLFVVPEVLIVRLIRLFRHVSKQLPINDSRCIFLQRRIVQLMIAYCKYHEADVTYAVLERLWRFLQSFDTLFSLKSSILDFLTSGGGRNCNKDNYNNNMPPSAVVGRISTVFSAVAVEVALQLKELSVFVENNIQRIYAPVCDGRGGSYCQRKLMAPLKALGTVLKTHDGTCNAKGEGKHKAHLWDAPAPLLGVHTTKMVFIDMDVDMLTEQMCLLSFRMFSNIHMRELLNNAWCDEVMRMGTPSQLACFIEYSSHVQQWITVSIVRQNRWSHCRTALELAIRFCRLLYGRQNYEVAAAVLGGLQHSAVLAVKDSYQKLMHRPILGPDFENELETLQELMDPFASKESSSSYSSVMSYAAGNMEAPMIPLLGPVLGVLFRVEETKGKTVIVCQSNGVPVVNWSKIVGIAKTVFLWIRCQNTPYEYHVHPTMQQYLSKLPGHQYFDGTLTRLASQERLE